MANELDSKIKKFKEDEDEPPQINKPKPGGSLKTVKSNTNLTQMMTQVVKPPKEGAAPKEKQAEPVPPKVPAQAKEKKPVKPAIPTKEKSTNRAKEEDPRPEKAKI